MSARTNSVTPSSSRRSTAMASGNVSELKRKRAAEEKEKQQQSSKMSAKNPASTSPIVTRSTSRSAPEPSPNGRKHAQGGSDTLSGGEDDEAEERRSEDEDEDEDDGEHEKPAAKRTKLSLAKKAKESNLSINKLKGLLSSADLVIKLNTQKPRDLEAEVWDELLKASADPNPFVSIHKIHTADLATLCRMVWESEGAAPTIDHDALKSTNVRLAGPYDEIGTEIGELEQRLAVLRGLHDDFKQRIDRTTEIMRAEHPKRTNEDLQNLIEAAQKRRDADRRAMLESFGMAMPAATAAAPPPPPPPPPVQCGIGRSCLRGSESNFRCPVCKRNQCIECSTGLKVDHATDQQFIGCGYTNANGHQCPGVIYHTSKNPASEVPVEDLYANLLPDTPISTQFMDDTQILNRNLYAADE